MNRHSAGNVLVTSTYVDDIIAGANTVDCIIRLQQQIIALLERGCFGLKKWASNYNAELDSVNKEDLAIYLFFEPAKELAIKVNGL